MKNVITSKGKNVILTGVVQRLDTCQECGGDRLRDDHSACDQRSMNRAMKRLGRRMAEARMELIWGVILGP